jgi:hypothetical protein
MVFVTSSVAEISMLAPFMLLFVGVVVGHDGFGVVE